MGMQNLISLNNCTRNFKCMIHQLKSPTLKFYYTKKRNTSLNSIKKNHNKKSDPEIISHCEGSDLEVDDHLDEIKERIFCTLTYSIILFAIFYLKFPDIVNILKSLNINLNTNLIEFSPGEAFFTAVDASVDLSVLGVFPMLIYQMSIFFLPGITRKEQFYFSGLTTFINLLFFLAYYFLFSY